MKLEGEAKCEGCDGLIPFTLEFKEGQPSVLQKNGGLAMPLWTDREKIDEHLAECEGRLEELLF